MSNPLVSIITPTTRDREQYNKKIAQIVHGQTYQNFEHLWDYGEGTIGAKRNRLCEQAKGAIILHMDSDDTYANDWVAKSVEFILNNKCDVTGLQDGYFSNGKSKWLYRCQIGRPYVLGATMCYWKAFWERFKFLDVKIGEDTHWILDNKCLVSPHKYIDGFVASIHEGNTCTRTMSDPAWKLVS